MQLSFSQRSTGTDRRCSVEQSSGQKRAATVCRILAAEFLKSSTRCLFQQPASSQERGSGLAVGRQGGPGSAGGPGAVDQARDLSPCLPASMGDAARPTTLPCSPPAAHHHGPHHTPLHQTHCGTNNNCYDGPTTPYDSRDYDSPGGWLIFYNSFLMITSFFILIAFS